MNKQWEKVRFFYNQALTLFSLGNFTQAIQYYNKILCMESNDTDALIGKVDNLVQLERYDEAIFFYNRALDIDPTNAYASSMKNVTTDALNIQLRHIK